MNPVGRLIPQHVFGALRAARHAALEPYQLARARRLNYREEPFEPACTLVSVIIPTYDRLEILYSRTIPALMRQSHRRLEIIVIGDACPESTAHAHRKACADRGILFKNLRIRTRYPRDVLSRWMVLGTRPMNVGARLASGSWLLFISDDDELLPDAVEAMLNTAAISKAEVIFTPDIDDESIRVRVPIDTTSWKSLKIENCFSKVFMMRSYLQFFRWNSGSHKKLWNRPADYDLYFRMQHAGVHFAMTPEPGCVLHAVPGTDGRHGSSAALWQGSHDV